MCYVQRMMLSWEKGGEKKKRDMGNKRVCGEVIVTDTHLLVTLVKFTDKIEEEDCVHCLRQYHIPPVLRV